MAEETVILGAENHLVATLTPANRADARELLAAIKLALRSARAPRRRTSAELTPCLETISSKRGPAISRSAAVSPVYEVRTIGLPRSGSLPRLQRTLMIALGFE